MAESPHKTDRSVVIGYDGSPQGHDALALGRQLAKVLDARPLVATVVLYPDHLAGAQERHAMATGQRIPAARRCG